MSDMDQRAAEILARRKGDAQADRPSLDERAAAIMAKRGKGGIMGEVAPVDPDSLSSTFGRGVDNLQANLGGTVEAIGEATGSQYLADAGAKYRAEQVAEAAKYGAPTNVSSVYDVNDVDTAGQWAQENIIGSLPSMAPTVGGALVGSRYGPVGTAVGALLGSLGVNIGDVQNRIKELDPDAKSPWTAIGSGTVMAGLDAVGATALLRPVLKTLGKEITYNTLVKNNVPKGVAIDLIKGGMAEGLTEGGQEIIAGVGAASGSNTKLDIEKTVENAINSTLAGTILGGAARVGTGAHARVNQNDMVEGSGTVRSTEPGDTSREGLAGRVWNALGGHATSKLEGLANATPLAREFVQNFRPDMTGKTASQKTLYESGDLMAGKWRTELNESARNWDDARLGAAIDDASDTSKTKDNPDAVAFRKVMDDIHSTAKAKGLDDIGYVEGHMPFRLDRDTMAANPEYVIQKFLPYFKNRENTQKALDDYLAQEARLDNPDLVPQIKRQVEMNDKGEWVIAKAAQKGKDEERARYRFAQGDVIPEFGHLERTRAFASVPQHILNEFAIEQTPKGRFNAIKDYVEGAAHRLAFTERFGADGSKANAQILKIVKDAQSKGRAVPKAEVDRMYDLLDAYSGTLGRISDPTLKTVQSTVGAVLTMKTLPLAALSSISEFMTPAIRGEVGMAIKAIAPTWAQIAKDVVRPLTKAPRTEFSLLASEANISFEAATSVASERLGANIFSKSAAKANRAFFIANGLSALTHVTRVYAAKTAEQIFNRNIQALAQGLPASSAIGTRYVNQLRSMGVDVSTKAEALSLWTPNGPAEMLARRETLKGAMKRFADQSVLETNLSNTPLWMNEPKMGMLAMLKRYPAAFGNTILPQLARRFSPTYAGSASQAAAGIVGSTFLLGMLIGLGYVQDELKMIAKTGEYGYDDTRSESQRFMDVINSVAMPLQGSMIFDFFASPRYGSDPVSTTLGPAAGAAKDITMGTYKTISDFENAPGIISETLYNQTPARPFKWAKEWISDQADF